MGSTAFLATLFLRAHRPEPDDGRPASSTPVELQTPYYPDQRPPRLGTAQPSRSLTSSCSCRQKRGINRTWYSYRTSTERHAGGCMGIGVQRTVKLAVLALVAGVMIGSVVRGVPDLSTGSGSIASLLLGLIALAWMVVRTVREGGFVAVGDSLLAGVPRAERRVLRRTRRRPEQVPEHLAALAARYARQQADSNDRFGWITVALVLFQAPTQSNHLLGSSPVGSVAYVLFMVALGFAGDRLGQLWHRAERIQQQRLASRSEQQWTPRPG